MSSLNTPDSSSFALALRTLHESRRLRVGTEEKKLRRALSQVERAAILSKTNNRCHICGGKIEGQEWQADHVLAHSAGGQHSLANYLAAHALCNNYRWHYDAEEFQVILKLGVWMRTQIEKQTVLGVQAAEGFCKHERKRQSRRKQGNF